MEVREIKELREKIGLTRAEFARELGVTAQVVYLWDYGKIKRVHSTTEKAVKNLQKRHKL